MAKKNFKVIDTFTGKESYFPNYDAWIASTDGKVNKEVKEKIFERSNTADKNFAMDNVASTTRYYRANGDSDSTFQEGGQRVLAAADKTLDQAADEYASKFDPQPKTIGGMFGLAMGRAYKGRLDKIEAAGGKEAFKAAKQEKSSAKRMKRDKDLKQQRKDLKQKTAGIRTEVTSRPPLDYGKVTNQKEVKGVFTKGKYGI